MKGKSLWRISVTTLPEAEEAVSELLLNLCGQPCVTYTDLEAGVSNVSCYLDQKPDWVAVKKNLSASLAKIKKFGLKVGSAKTGCEKVRRENWAESWKRHFKPLVIGKSLLIKPSWSQRRPHRQQAVVMIDPGLSFGTGQHPTTSFCLRQVAAYRPKSSKSAGKEKSKSQKRSLTPSLLDIGTGSGILAIAAAKLGYGPVEAFDFDPEAVKIARANARRNHVAEKIRIFSADVTHLPRRHSGQFSLVCANLISNLLISEQPSILSKLAPNGALVLAGILATEFKIVQKAYEKAGLKLIASRHEKEWCSATFVRI